MPQWRHLWPALQAHRARIAARAWACAARALLLAALWPGMNAAVAQGLESALSPGPLARAHAKLEGDCKSCHVRFDRAAQDGLCAACHKEVGQDLRAHTGMHGRLKPQPCRTCHTDHRGVEARIVSLDRKTFDHRMADFELRGKHATADCALCHKAGRKEREAPHDCLSCHRADDKHKGAFGAACVDCHNETSWKDARVDHSKTRFPLTGRHTDVQCASCHKIEPGVAPSFKGAPLTCIGCHRKDDKHKARFGEKCDSCHGTKGWATITFRHDQDTRFALRGRHREVRCESCHVGALYRDKLGTTCADCHRSADPHKGTLGNDCASCHNEQRWRDGARFDHDKSRFKLRGAHGRVECKDCHRSADYRATPSACADCHRKDDRHDGTLGTDCTSCHTDVNWRATRFDHAGTRFALTEAHGVPPLQCLSCHRDLRSYRQASTECLSCHRKDDPHALQLGARCESCHNTANWRVAGFDHSKTRFALIGSHQKVACKDCHKSGRYREAPRECIGCHLAADKHKARLGTECASCHNARDWRLWNYDHARRATYPLDGAHARTACVACHRAPAPAGKSIATVDRACVSCHRADDKHDGAFGTRCENCHDTGDWKRVSHRARGSQPPTGVQR